MIMLFMTHLSVSRRCDRNEKASSSTPSYQHTNIYSPRTHDIFPIRTLNCDAKMSMFIELVVPPMTTTTNKNKKSNRESVLVIHSRDLQR